MEDHEYTIYALKIDENMTNIVYNALKNGEGRFGWSYVQTADLRELKRKIDENGWDSLSAKEKDCYQPFLLEFKEGDYVIYINTPTWGECTIARVTGGYYFKWDPEIEDFSHRFKVDPASVVTFNRNDAVVHRKLSTRLKLQGRYWRIYAKEEFEELLKALKDGRQGKEATIKDSMEQLAKEILPLLGQITQRIHHTHPNYDLEKLLEVIFNRIPTVVEVTRKGGAGDHGADLIIVCEEGLDIAGIKEQKKYVIQVKSYEGQHWDTKAVEDLRRAFERYPDVEGGIIVSTADESTKDLDDAMQKLRHDTGKKVGILIGPDVAKFILPYFDKLI